MSTQLKSPTAPFEAYQSESLQLPDVHAPPHTDDVGIDLDDDLFLWDDSDAYDGICIPAEIEAGSDQAHGPDPAWRRIEAYKERLWLQRRLAELH